MFVRPAVPTPTMAKDSRTPEEAKRRGGFFSKIPTANYIIFRIIFSIIFRNLMD